MTYSTCCCLVTKLWIRGVCVCVCVRARARSWLVVIFYTYVDVMNTGNSRTVIKVDDALLYEGQ
jgi:hypothetical protein